MPKLAHVYPQIWLSSSQTRDIGPFLMVFEKHKCEVDTQLKKTADKILKMGKPEMSTSDIAQERSAKDWMRILIKYRDPSTSRSITEIAFTACPLLFLWALGILLLGWHPVMALPISIIAGLFIVRLFIIQHDCGHGAYLKNRTAQDWIGRVCGVFTCTPYADWKYVHSVHHSHAGNLDKRGLGEVYTMTLEEYRSVGSIAQLKYRMYRHPIFLFGFAPWMLFLICYRAPHKLTAARRYWVSTQGTNLGILTLLAVFWAIGGVQAILLVWLPTVMVAAALGVWLFYVQHQFEETYWDNENDWDMHDAALEGASHYVMPKPLRWITGNIGIHHIHHLFSRIPFYRLPEVLRDYPELEQMQRLTIPQSLSCSRRHLWYATDRRLLTFAEAKRLPA